MTYSVLFFLPGTEQRHTHTHKRTDQPTDRQTDAPKRVREGERQLLFRFFRVFALKKEIQHALVKLIRND